MELRQDFETLHGQLVPLAKLFPIAIFQFAERPMKDKGDIGSYRTGLRRTWGVRPDCKKEVINSPIALKSLASSSPMNS